MNNLFEISMTACNAIQKKEQNNVILTTLQQSDYKRRTAEGVVIDQYRVT